MLLFSLWRGVLLKNPGKSILEKAEVQNVSSHGVWVLVNEQEFFMPFSEFPWFLKATIAQIYNVQFFHGHHLHWPDLDVDIDIDALKHPSLYPLKYV
jgi:hypothetical protein